MSFVFRYSRLNSIGVKTKNVMVSMRLDAVQAVCASTPHAVNQILEEGLWQLVPFLHNGRLKVTYILDMLSPIRKDGRKCFI